MENLARRDHRRLSAAWRIVWTLLTLTIVQLFVCGVSALPVVGLWSFLLSITPSNATVRLLAVSAAIVPCYMLFALCLMFVSPLAVRLLRWHTPPADAVPIDDLGWPLMQWVRYAASIHIPRVVAGTLFRGTPIWTLHLRLNGARLGRQVYINTLSVSDYNLLEFGDHVVIGGAVQLSGHTVEQGVLKTATVRIRME